MEYVLLAILIVLCVALFYLIIRTRDISQDVYLLREKVPIADEMRKEASATIASLNKEIGSLNQKAQEIGAIRNEVTNLRNLFTRPSGAGGAGERLLEKAISDVLGSDMYDTQYRLSSGSVDFVVKFRECLVPIDSKLPLDNFRKMLEENDENRKRNHWKTFANEVKKRVDETSKYILPNEGTTDFAFMYIASESVYYEAFIKDSQFGEDNILSEYAMRRKVCPVSPQTIYPYLVTILQGMKALKIEENAKEIVNKISGLRNEFQRFEQVYGVIVGHIKDAQNKHMNEGAPKIDSIRRHFDGLESK